MGFYHVELKAMQLSSKMKGQFEYIDTDNQLEKAFKRIPPLIT